jgi:hypothetical protein
MDAMKAQITLRTRLVMLVLAAIVPLFGLSIYRPSTTPMPPLSAP